MHDASLIPRGGNVYREHAAPSLPRTHVHYLPGVGVLALVPFLLAALPVALLLRTESRVASTVTCATGSGVARCWVREAGGISWRSASCPEALADLDRLATGTPLSVPYLDAMTVDGPVLDAVPAPPMMRYPQASKISVTAKHVAHFGNDFWKGSTIQKGSAPPPPAPVSTVRAAVQTAPPDMPTDTLRGVTHAQARTLLESCTSAPVNGGDHARTVSIAAFARSDERAVLALVAAALLGLVWMLRRRVEVDVDGSTVGIVERVFGREVARREVAREDLVGATVATGVSGLLGGRRVELVRRDGGRVPLHAAFVPFTRSSHESAAFRLSELL